MDKLLAKDWQFDEFVKRYTFLDPQLVLTHPIDMSELFEKYRQNEHIIFNEAIRCYPQEFPAGETTFERLTRMAHFGLPTRHISGVEKSTDGQKEHVALKFHPLPPFLFEEDGVAFCLLKGDSGGRAKLIKCKDKTQVDLPNLGVDVASALTLLGIHQRLRVEGDKDSLDSFTDWKTL